MLCQYASAQMWPRQIHLLYWACQWRHLCLWFHDNVPFRGSRSVNCQQSGRTGGAEEDKIKEQDLVSSMLRAPLFLSLSFFFCLKQVQSLNPSVPPLSLKSISLGFLECQSCPLTPPPPHPQPSHLVHSTTFFFVVISSLPVLYTTWFPQGVRGCVKWISKCYWKWKDLRSKTEFFQWICNVTLWILMAC